MSLNWLRGLLRAAKVRLILLDIVIVAEGFVMKKIILLLALIVLLACVFVSAKDFGVINVVIKDLPSTSTALPVDQSIAYYLKYLDYKLVFGDSVSAAAASAGSNSTPAK